MSTFVNPLVTQKEQLFALFVRDSTDYYVTQNERICVRELCKERGMLPFYVNALNELLDDYPVEEHLRILACIGVTQGSAFNSIITQKVGDVKVIESGNMTRCTLLDVYISLMCEIQDVVEGEGFQEVKAMIGHMYIHYNLRSYRMFEMGLSFAALFVANPFIEGIEASSLTFSNNNVVAKHGIKKVHQIFKALTKQ